MGVDVTGTGGWSIFALIAIVSSISKYIWYLRNVAPTIPANHTNFDCSHIWNANWIADAPLCGPTSLSSLLLSSSVADDAWCTFAIWMVLSTINIQPVLPSRYFAIASLLSRSTLNWTSQKCIKSIWKFEHGHWTYYKPIEDATQSWTDFRESITDTCVAKLWKLCNLNLI